MKIKNEIEDLKEKEALKRDVSSFFSERDKNNTDKSADVSEILNIEAELKQKLYEDSLKEVPLKKGVQPMFNTIFLSAKRNKVTTDSGLYLPTASFGAGGETDLEIDYSDIQTVMAAGPQVQQAVVGMEIKITMDNFKRKLGDNMAQKVNKDYDFLLPVVNIDGQEYIKISERDIDYIVDTKGLINKNK